MIITGAALLFGAIPFFELMHTTDPLPTFLGQLGLVVAMAILSGGLTAANVELMPSTVRCTGLAFAYNASSATSAELPH